MSRLIDADTLVHWQSYDDEHETFPEESGTIADLINQMTMEGCPEPVDAVPVRRGRWIIRTRHEHYPSGRAYEEIVCPFCGKVDHNGDGYFCGYCGARMDGKDGDHAEGTIQKERS